MVKNYSGYNNGGYQSPFAAQSKSPLGAPVTPASTPAPTQTANTFQRSSVFGPADVQQPLWSMLESLYNESNQYLKDAPQRQGALDRLRRAADPGLAGSRYTRNLANLSSQANRTGMGNAARLGNMGYGQAAQDAALLSSQNAGTEAANNAYLQEFSPESRINAANAYNSSFSPQASMQSLGAFSQLLNLVNQTQQTANSKPKESGGLLSGLLDIAGSVVPLIPLPGEKKSNSGMA